jgi:hypothetical protein
MIDNVNDFIKIHPNAIIINYDYSNGVVYRAKTNTLEAFRKIKGEYIKFPMLQHFQKGRKVQTELYIIHKKKLYFLERINPEDSCSNYRKALKLNNISDSFYNDKVFKEKPRVPRCSQDEIILEIVK